MEKELFKASQKLNKLDFNISFEGISVNVFWFRAMIMHEGSIISRHRHSSFEFHVVKEGACRVILDDGEYIVNAGEMYITPPGVFHEQIVCPGADYVEYSLNFDIKEDVGISEEEKRICKIYKNMPFAIIYNTEELEMLFEMAYKKMKDMSIGYYNDLKHIILIIINTAAAAVSENSECSYEVPQKNDLTDLRFEKIDRYIKDNLTSRVKISDIAKIMYFSEKQIGRIVKKCTGRTAKDYILYLRHEKSKDYLKHSERSISDIAEIMGFSSVAHFVSDFKKREGYTPLVFRKSVKG